MSYSSEVLADSPLAYYKLDETTGTTLVDSSGNGRDGTWNGTPTRGVMGAQGTGFTTGTGYASAPDAAWNSFSGPFSVEFGYRPNGADGYLVEKYSGGFALRVESKRLKAYTLGGSTTSVTAPYQLTTNYLHHCVFTFDGTNGRLYVDGALIAGPTPMATPTDGTASLKIGARGDDAAVAAVGDLDEVALYSGALSAARVTAHFDAFLARDTAPKAWWKLDETSGTTMADSSGAGRNGTYSGAILGQTALRGTGFAAKGGVTGQGVASVAAPAGSVFDSGEFTVALNVQLTTTNSSRGLISRGSWILLQSGGTVAFYIDDTVSGTGIMGGPALATGVNKRLALAVSSGRAKLYVDGSLATTWTFTQGVLSSSTALQIGGYSGANYSEAIFDDVKFWDCALTAAEVAAEFSGSTGSAVSVSAPALVVVEAVPAPTVTAGAKVTVAAPALGMVEAVPAPTVSAGTGVRVDAPAMGVVTAVPAPSVVMGGPVNVDAPALGITTALAAPAVSAGSSVRVAAPAIPLTFAAPAPTVTVASGAVTVAVPVLSLVTAVPAPTVTGVTAETVFVSTTRTPVGILSVLPLVPVTPLATAVPITRVSVLAPDLSAAYPAHPAPGEAGAPAVIEEVVGYPQLFIGGRNVTNLRGVQTLIRRWESEAPFGDTAAAFEFPQLNPWDQPGAGDLDFLGRDAPVAIGIREEVAPGAFRVRRLWSGFLDARGNGLGEGEDYSWEAKGTFWQAQSFLREPHPLPASEPVDIGVWIARVMNAVDGRRWATMPLTPIGITTRTRGHRGQYAMEYVQELLSEAITDDFRQWTLVEVAPGVPRLVLKPAPTEVHATVAYGTPGVDVDLRIDESTRVDRIFMRGIGKNAGGWANIFYPWLYKIDDAPPYPMAGGANITLGTTDADTVSGSGVTDFQRRVDELDGFANPAISGVMSSGWMAVVDDLQRRLNLPVGPLDSTTWERVFDGRPNLEGIKPRRLPMASKPEAEKYLYDADGRRLPGVNPAWDGRVPRDIDIDAGVGKGKAEGFKLARKILGLFGDAAANGQIVWTTDPKETDRTKISHLSNIKVTGFEGRDVVVQVSQKSVELDDGDKAYVVTTRVDERARDAMVVEDLLNQRREAKADPSRRPGVTNRASRQVEDQRTPWDIESPCGKLRRTFVPSGQWKIRHIPFAEVGKLARISIDSTAPFSFAIFASLRVTEAHLNAKGSPFASADFWRDNKDYFDGFGIIEAWGEQNDACGYSPKSEADGGPFTGKFRLDSPVDYWTETPPVVAVAFYTRGGSGWVEGGQDDDGVRRGFIPAYEA